MKEQRINYLSVNCKDTAEKNIDKLIFAVKDKCVVIWGAAGTGKFYGEILIQSGVKIEYFVDKNADVIKSLYGLPVFLPEKLNKETRNIIVILAGSEKVVEQILEDNAIEAEYINGAAGFNILQESQRMLRVKSNQLPEEIRITDENKNGLSVPFFELVVTTHCTLRCKHCAHFGAHYYFAKNGRSALKNIEFDTIQRSLTKILEAVDEVREISIVGGEPLLYPQLDKVIGLLEKSNKVLRIEIATNGTIIPNDKILKAMDIDKLYVTISVYGDLSDKANELKKLLDDKGIENRIQVQGYGWDDLGEHTDHGRSISEMKQVYQSCFDTRYKLILEENIYDCHRVANATNLGYYTPQDSEYINLQTCTKSELREKIKSLYQHQYIPYCNYCNGKGDLVVAGLQYSQEEISEFREKNNY